MDVHFLGTTGYHPNDQRHTMSIFIPEFGIAMDAGTGFYRVRELLETENLHIFLSHAHLDHIVGLTFLYDVLYQKEVDVQAIAMEGKLDVIEKHLFQEEIFPVAPPYMGVPLGEEVTGLPEGVEWKSFPVKHPGGAVGYRFELPGQKSIAYVTDTTATLDADYLQHIQDADLLIHECYFRDGLEDRAELTGHSCLTPVLEVAVKSNAKRLALIHLNPIPEGAPTDQEIQDALKVLGSDLEVIVPADRSVITVG